MVRTRCGLAAVLAVALVLGGCERKHSATRTLPRQAAWFAYSDGHGLSFTYPATWKLGHPGTVAGVGGQPYPFVCLGSEPLDSCLNWYGRLPPNGVAVLWLAVDTSSAANGTPSSGTPSYDAGSCSGTVAEGSAARTWRVGVTRTVYAAACWRGPKLGVISAQVQAMFASVKVTAAAYPPCHTRPQTQPPGVPPRIDDTRPCIPPPSGFEPVTQSR
jgi:hypothetical protein